MAKQRINIKDFNLFYETLKAVNKIVDSAKIIISETGLEIYGARPGVARCEITTDAVYSSTKTEFSIEKLSVFLKIVATVNEIHESDFSNLNFYIDLPFIRFESKKFKTKYSTCNEDIIQSWISKKIQTEMIPEFEFTSTSDFIKRVNNHSFMFSDPKNARVYLETRDDMENNIVSATIGNRETELNNEITFKFALVTNGSLYKRDSNNIVISERKIILDLERLNLFNIIQSSDIKFQLMTIDCLTGKIILSGKNGTFLNIIIYSTILKN